MHLTDEQLERLADNEVSEAQRLALAGHLVGCAECRAREAAAMAGAESLSRLLGLLDHPVPGLTAGEVIRRASTPSVRAGRWAAAVLLSLALAGVAYAAPGSPLPGWLGAVRAWIAREQPTPSPGQPEPAPEPGGAGIAVLPGEHLVIRLQPAPRDGTLRVRLSDGAEVAVRTTGGAAGFLTGTGQLVIEARAEPIHLEVDIPRSAASVEIVAGGRSLLHKAGERVTSQATSTPDGTYLLLLGP